MENNLSGWGTESEKKFLNEMGPHLLSSPNSRTTRLSLLKNYRKTINKRSIWGHIDKEEIKIHCDHLIEMEER